MYIFELIKDIIYVYQISPGNGLVLYELLPIILKKQKEKSAQIFLTFCRKKKFIRISFQILLH